MDPEDLVPKNHTLEPSFPWTRDPETGEETMTTQKEAQVTLELEEMQTLFEELRWMGSVKVPVDSVLQYIKDMRQRLEL